MRCTILRQAGWRGSCRCSATPSIRTISSTHAGVTIVAADFQTIRRLADRDHENSHFSPQDAPALLVPEIRCFLPDRALKLAVSRRQLDDTVSRSTALSDRLWRLHQHTLAYQQLLGVMAVTWEGSAGTTANAGFVQELVRGRAPDVTPKATT